VTGTSARQILEDLRAVRDEREPRQAYLRRAVTRLVDLHEAGGLPAKVDDLDFVAAAADLLVQARVEVGVLVGLAVYDADAADPDDLYDLLVLRSALQYLIDDFRGTPAAGLVSAEPLAEMDEHLARLKAERDPLPAGWAPKGTPASHRWWQPSG
jgi:hypothetical protein